MYIGNYSNMQNNKFKYKYEKIKTKYQVQVAEKFTQVASARMTQVQVHVDIHHISPIACSM